MAMSFSTQVLRCDPTSITFPPSSSPQISSPETLRALETAAHDLVSRHQVVVFPTETVYGLGAAALVPAAVARIFSTKGRPSDNPLILHVSSRAMLQSLLPPDYAIPHTYTTLMDAFWPGALTLLFPADPSRIPAAVTAGRPTVAVRMPSHPVARALITFADTPLAAPSANSSGKPSPTRAEHVQRDLDGKVALILDGGPCAIGLESTVVDGLQPDGALRVLRPGGITVEDIERVLADEAAGDGDARVPRVLVHRRDYSDEEMEQAPTTPGMKYRHYSPSVPVVLLMTSTPPPAEQAPVGFADVLDSLRHLRRDSASPLKVGVLAPSDSRLNDSLSAAAVEWRVFALGTRSDPAISAARLFDGLLTLEKEGVDAILIEEIEEEREGLAYMNRVRKAAGETRWLHLYNVA